jgi:hypothetical protein
MKIRNEELRLSLSDIDWDVIDTWSNYNRDIIHVFEFDIIPENIIIQFADFFIEAHNELSKDEIESGDAIFTQEDIREKERENLSLDKKMKKILITNEKNEIITFTEIENVNSKIIYQGEYFSIKTI